MNHKSSKLELKVENILQQNNIFFKREVSFDDLNGCNNTPLRFDFVIYKNNNIFCIIETDGEQHFKFVKHFHKNIFGFKKSLEWDRRKSKYCLVHNIPLIRIPYWDYNTLTFKKIFTEPSYQVKTKYHNDNLIRGD